MNEVALEILKRPIPSDEDVVSKLQYQQTASWACDEINLLSTQLTGADKEIERLNSLLDEHEKLNLKLTEEIKTYKDPEDMIKIAKGKLLKVFRVYCECSHGEYCVQSESSMCTVKDCPIIRDILAKDIYEPVPASALLGNLNEDKQ